MDAVSYSLGGEFVTTQVVAKMEETMQAFAVRAACFVGELDVPYSEEFDGRDFGAIHLLAYVGREPVGTLRLRWFRSFGMPERLAVVQRFRGHNIGRLLLEHCYRLAESRGCNVLYSRAVPACLTYLEKQGWRCLEPERPAAVGGRTAAVVRSVDLAKPWPELDPIDALSLSREFRPEFPVLAAAHGRSVDSPAVGSRGWDAAGMPGVVI
jgi:GNAT superfamily N-acetyltransferase